MKLRASFVIPAYNAELFLAQAILSCRSQSVKEIEILVVDDGSTDGTRELAEWHANEDSRVRVISSGFTRETIDVPRKQLLKLAHEALSMRKNGMVAILPNVSNLQEGIHAYLAKITSLESITKIENELSKLYECLCSSGKNKETSLSILWDCFISGAPSRLYETIGDHLVLPSLSSGTPQTSRNLGRSVARNVGNSYASSPFIFVLDSDDLAHKNRVRDTLITFQMKNPDVVYGPFDVVDEQDQTIGRQPAGPWNKELSIKRQQNYIGHSTMAYRKGVAIDVPYDEGEFSHLGLDDWKFQWDCIQKGYKFEVCKQTLSRYRIYRLPNETYGSTTEFNRNPEEVKKIKDAYLDGISEKV